MFHDNLKWWSYERYHLFQPRTPFLVSAKQNDPSSAVCLQLQLELLLRYFLSSSCVFIHIIKWFKAKKHQSKICLPWVMGASLKRMRIPWLWQLTARNCGRRCCPKVFKMNIHLKVCWWLEEIRRWLTSWVIENIPVSLETCKGNTIILGWVFHQLPTESHGEKRWARSSYHGQMRMNQKWWIFWVKP